MPLECCWWQLPPMPPHHQHHQMFPPHMVNHHHHYHPYQVCPGISVCGCVLAVIDVKRIPPNDPLVCFFGGGCRESVRWSWISFLGAWELNPGFLCLVSEIDVSKCKSHFSCTQCRLGAFNLGAYNKPKNVGPLQTDTKRFSQRIQRK